ncbi:MAG: tetratricopeptide repeat protein [Melioribacteraceae bacterium]
MISFKQLYQEIKTRKLRKTLIIYISSGITVLGVVNLFSGVYHLPMILFDCILTVIICGIPSAIVFAWHHNLEGKQKIQKKEIVLYSISLLIAVVIIVWITGLGGVRLLPSDAKTIAVLPFKNLSDNKEDEYFSDGIMEDILTQLSKISDLRIISRTSMMQYKNTKKNLRQIGEELNVATILEGSVRRAGGRVRIVGQLINARKDEHIWAETYDRELKDVFAIQTEVAKNIAASLQAILSPKELEQIENKSTVNLDAYTFYLRGRDYFYRYTKQDNEKAIELFRNALKLDPNYALAYAGLAGAYGRKKYYDSSQEWIDSALTLSSKAISINPNLAEGYKALGDVYTSKGNNPAALTQYIKAVELNPNYGAAIANVGYIYYQYGLFDEALKWTKKAVITDPGFARYSSNMGVQYFSLGYDSLAAIWLNKALILQPEFFFPNIILTYIDLYTNRFDEARARINKLLSNYSDVPAVYETVGDIELIAGNYKLAKQYYEKVAELTSLMSAAGIKLSYVLIKLNQRAEAQKILSSYLTADTEDPNQYSEGTITYYTAAAYCVVGKNQMALKFLQRSLELGFREYRWALIDPLMNSLQNDEKYKSLINTLKSTIATMRNRVKAENL